MGKHGNPNTMQQDNLRMNDSRTAAVRPAAVLYMVGLFAWFGCCTCCFCCSTGVHSNAELDMRGASKGPVPVGHRKNTTTIQHLCVNVITYCCCTCCCAAIHGGWVGPWVGCCTFCFCCSTTDDVLLLVYMVHAGGWVRGLFPLFFCPLVALLRCGSLAARIYSEYITITIRSAFRQYTGPAHDFFTPTGAAACHHH